MLKRTRWKRKKTKNNKAKKKKVNKKKKKEVNDAEVNLFNICFEKIKNLDMIAQGDEVEQHKIFLQVCFILWNLNPLSPV
ncbi:hypothetical protein M8J77_020665 [Diaphorina citri]|nr:hypothetical protein M8J77_020665 [Diaphorina citri]